MKVELSIRDDKELRDTIKDMIRGQVKSIVREDVDSILKELVTNRTPSEESVYNMVRTSMDAAAKHHVERALGGYNMREVVRNMVKDVVVDEVRRALGK